MEYREFGNTGISVSVLGFGAMRLPTVGEEGEKRVDLERAVPMLTKGLDLGINYVDTAWGYLNKTSEKAVGEALAGRDRSSIYIATKNMIDTDVKAYRKRLDLQLAVFAFEEHFHALLRITEHFIAFLERVYAFFIFSKGLIQRQVA